MIQYLSVVSAPGGLTQSVISDLPGKKQSVTWLTPDCAAVIEAENIDEAALADVAAAHRLDYRLSPETPIPARIFLADMDSTMITIECIDELADYAGLKEEVSAVTEAAMRGELDFEQALRSRVALLEGLPEATLEECFNDRVVFSPGAESAVKTMAAHDCICALVSGGFTFFTERVAAGLGFHLHRANTLEVKDGRLTGHVLPPISNAATKLSTLNELKEKEQAPKDTIVAVGDGANDIPMLQAAGLGVAYKAKPKTAAAVHAAIEHTDLTTLLYFQGLKPL